MWSYSLFSWLVAAHAVVSSAFPAITPNAVPKFENLFCGEFELAAIHSLDATFGTRLNIALKGGKLTDTSGNHAAMLLPPPARGSFATPGYSFPKPRCSWRWAADNKFAYLRLDGVGIPYESDVVYVYGSISSSLPRLRSLMIHAGMHMETDSEAHSALNSRFLVANVTFADVQGSNPLFTLFGLV